MLPVCNISLSFHLTSILLHSYFWIYDWFAWCLVCLEMTSIPNSRPDRTGCSQPWALSINTQHILCVVKILVVGNWTKADHKVSENLDILSWKCRTPLETIKSELTPVEIRDRNESFHSKNFSRLRPPQNLATSCLSHGQWPQKWSLRSHTLRDL